MSDTPTPRTDEENIYEQFCENPECRECGAPMRLNGDCEWPEDERLWLCSSCMSEFSEKLLEKYEKSQSTAQQLERELAEVTKQRDDLHALHNKNAARNAEILAECQTLRQQRDALAEALESVMVHFREIAGDCSDEKQREDELESERKAEQALASTKGDSQTTHCKDDFKVNLVNFLTVARADCNTQAKVFDQCNMELSKEGSLAMSMAYQITLNFINEQTTKGVSHE